MPSPWPQRAVNSPTATSARDGARLKRALLLTRWLAWAGQSGRNAGGALVLGHRCSAASANLLAVGEDDPGLQVYRYTDKPELGGALRGELGPLPETKPSSCHGNSEKSPSELKPPAAEQPHG